MATPFNRRPEQQHAGIGPLAAEIMALRVRRQAHAEALVRRCVTPGVASTLSLFR